MTDETKKILIEMMAQDEALGLYKTNTMKEKTAMRQLIDYSSGADICHYTEDVRRIIAKAQELLSIERQQIERAYEIGKLEPNLWEFDGEKFVAAYYSKVYGND